MNYSILLRRCLSILCTLTLFPCCRQPLKEIENTPPTSESVPSQDGFWDTSDIDISKIDNSKKLIAFSFDDAPARNFERILTVFAAHNELRPTRPASATFFCNGMRCTRSALPMLAAAHALCMELGNHSQHHYDLTTLNLPTLQREIEQTDEILRQIDNKATHLFRAPFGKVNSLLRESVSAPIFDWTIDTLDWTGVSADEIVETVLNGVYAGAVVLMHDGYDNTVDALKRLLPILDERGYQVVSISQMAKAHDCPLKIGGVYIRAREAGSR